MRRGLGTWVFAVAFLVLLLDGAAAVFLGQLSGRRVFIVVGLLIIAAAALVAFLYRRWQTALDDIDVARRDLKAEIGLLRSALDRARSSRGGSE
jgi:hypothetical protein